VLDLNPLLRPERAALLDLLGDLSADQWAAPTECPGWTVQGIATHLLGDDLSLLARQRDSQVPGLLLIAPDHPGKGFRELLDAFNDGWVEATRFLSPALVVELLRITGEWTAAFYAAVDLESPGEPVGFFGATGGPSPYWQAVAREYVERWVHQSQIRRAVGMPSLADEPFLRAGLEVVAAAGRVEAGMAAGRCSIAGVDLGPEQQAADLLTRAHTADEVRSLVSGPPDQVDVLVAAMSRPG
jgi:uncharacterized protein (TIGR03083 family)